MLGLAAVLAATTISLTSCGGGNPAQEVINKTKEATEQMKNAKSQEEALEIANKYQEDMEKLSKELEGYEATPTEQQAALKATMEFMEAAQAADEKFGY